MCKTYRYGQLPFQWVDHQTVTGLDIRAGPRRENRKKKRRKIAMATVRCGTQPGKP